MNKFYGGGGATRHGVMNREYPKAPECAALTAGRRTDALPASTPYGSQPGGDPIAVPRTPVGCHLPYAASEMLDGPPEVITDYADRRGY